MLRRISSLSRFNVLVKRNMHQKNNVEEYWKSVSSSLNIESVGKIRALVSTAVSFKRKQGDLLPRNTWTGFSGLYKQLNLDGKKELLKILNTEFGTRNEELADSVKEYLSTLEKGGNERAIQKSIAKLRLTATPLYEKFFGVINQEPGGMKFLVDLRADVLKLMNKDSDYFLHALDDNLKHQLQNWFSVGFLDLRKIDWNSSASLLEKIIEYEAVHPIQNWERMKQRLVGPLRRCYGFFHKSMEEEPLVFVEVALLNEIPNNIHSLLDDNRFLTLDSNSQFGEEPNPTPSTAIFYSISSTQQGLSGIDLGSFLIKRVVNELKMSYPSLNTFSTLSPIPGFMKWLTVQIGVEKKNVFENQTTSGKPLLLKSEVEKLKTLVPNASNEFEALEELLNSREEWLTNGNEKDQREIIMKDILLRLCASYLCETQIRGRAMDGVCHFHVRNGANVWRINWKGDLSSRGIKQSGSIMANYRYYLDQIETNNANYLLHGTIPCSQQLTEFLVKT